MSFWQTFVLDIAAATVAVVVGGLVIATGLMARTRRLIDQAVQDIGDQSYRQIGGLRDLVEALPDTIVERVDSTARAQHEETRRVLEHRTAYTGSLEIPLPTVAQMAAADPRRAQTSAARIGAELGDRVRAQRDEAHRVQARRGLDRPGTVPPPKAPDLVDRRPDRAPRHRSSSDSQRPPYTGL